MSFGPVGFPPQSNLIGAKVEIIDMTGGNGTSPSLPKKLNDDEKSSELYKKIHLDYAQENAFRVHHV